MGDGRARLLAGSRSPVARLRASDSTRKRMAVHASKSSVQTRLVHGGRNPACFSGMVNTPVHRGSTVVAASLAEWDSRKEPGNPTASYGRFGTPTTRSFEQVVADLEGGYRSIVFPSGLSACALSLLAFVRSGDHVLMSDAVYGPTRQFAENVLTRFGIQTTFFDPLAAPVSAQTSDRIHASSSSSRQVHGPSRFSTFRLWPRSPRARAQR